jgi:hypothetical protein
MNSSSDWLVIVLSSGAVASGVALYFGKARITTRRQKGIRADERLAELRAALATKPQSKTALSDEVEPTGRPLYELTDAILAHVGTRVERVDPHYAPGSPDFLWLLLAPDDTADIGERLKISTAQDDNDLWFVSRETTFKFDRPVTQWSMAGTMGDAVKGVLADLTSAKIWIYGGAVGD